MKPTPSATTKTLEEILLRFRQFARHNDSDMKLDSDLTIEDYIEYDKAQLAEALAAIDNYTTQRVIEELGKVKGKQLWGGEMKFEERQRQAIKYVDERLESLKGGIDG